MKIKTNILLTGSSGFVGQHFLSYNKEKYEVQTVSLQKTAIEDIDFNKIDTIVHSAGIAHKMTKIGDQIYFDVNTTLTAEFAKAAKAQGVKHFIYLSSVKVFDDTEKNTIFNEVSACNPTDAYGKSKYEGEQLLLKLNSNDFKVSIVRPPLIYGANVKGNMIRFLELGNSNYFLPLGNLGNRRTMVFIDNLIELINKIIDTQVSGTFIAGDAEPISTTYLISEIRNNLGKQQRLFLLPNFFIKILTSIKPAIINRLYGSLEFDTTGTNTKLNFHPPYTSKEGIKAMTNWYKTQYKK
jgi:nucleoside-diphosphate-sugar epimerase